MFDFLCFLEPLIVECGLDDDCPKDQLCGENGYCINPCLKTSCGDNAICLVADHTRQCCCPPGYIGSPYTVCVPKNG